MRKILIQLLPKNLTKRKWLAVFITAILSLLLTLLGIYGVGVYGLSLFVLTPLFIGICPSILIGIDSELSKKEALINGLITLCVFTTLLVLLAMEGLICIAMAMPFGILLTTLGSLIGYYLVKKSNKNTPNFLVLFLLTIPLYSLFEKKSSPEITSVTTSIEIQASPTKVWENVIEFPQLDPPKEFIFKTGIAFPVNAKIIGKGVGAIRHCNFTTGSFIEPVTTWDEEKLLAFDVLEQPAPMKEISFWDINAPHLHDFFVSKKGQFKLTKLKNGNTLLEGTTWYYHHIKPEFYWKVWSNYIVHEIHQRVLNHIKKNSEYNRATP